MSLLTKTESTVNSVPDTVASLRTQLRSLLASLGSPAPPTPASLSASLSSLRTSAASLWSSSASLQSSVSKFLSKANEADPERNPYNAATQQRIREMARRWEESRGSIEEVVREVEAEWAQAEERRRDAEQRAKAEAEGLRRRAEEERSRQQEETKRRKEEEERRRREEEQRRVDEASERLERDARQQQEAQQRQQQEAEARAKAEAEVAAQRKRQEAEAKAKQEADVVAAQAAAERELQSLPPLQQSRVRLSRALDELRLSCSVHSDYVLAVGMLLRFSSQIIANPQEPRHRSVNVHNPIIKQRLISKKGGGDALQAIGFTSRAAAATGSAAPAAREEGGETEDWSVQPTAEAWTIVTQAKVMLEAELKDAQSGKKRVVATASAPPASSASSSSPPSPAAPNAYDAFSQLFSQMINSGAGAGTGGGGARRRLPGVLADPLIQAMMSNPRLLQAAMTSRTAGANPTDLLLVMGDEANRNPAFLSAVLSSPLMSSLMKPFTALLVTMEQDELSASPPADASTASSPPAPAAAPAAASAAPSASPPPAVAASDAAAPMDVELTEEQLLEQALALSMQSEQQPDDGGNTDADSKQQ